MPLDLTHLKLLVVEDNDPMRELIRSVLTCLGASAVYTASDGRRGFELFQREKPDIVLTDWDMDYINGLDLTKKIRKDSDSINRAAPVIMVTGYSATSRVIKARDIGVNDFLMKPYTAESVSKHIANVINRPRSFIDCSAFTGPDRRRKKFKDSSGQKRRKEDKDASVKALYAPPSRELQIKAGTGDIDIDLIRASQQAIDQNAVDFAEIADEYMSLLDMALIEARLTIHDTSRTTIDTIAKRVMQIKAGAGMFRYPLASHLSGRMLEFIDSQPHLDKDILMMLEAYSNTLQHIVKNHIAEDPVHGQKMIDELEGAFRRYRLKMGQ